jgi:predicted nucleic acid-binding protein
MRHVFVETNWVVDFAAPAHHKQAKAVALLERARRGDLQLHLPAICLAEARQPILTKCRPRHEAAAIRQYLRWTKSSGVITEEQRQSTLEVLDSFEHDIRAELAQLDEIIAGLRTQAGIEVYALNDRMLERTIELSVLGLALKPFDQAILAAVLCRAEDLRARGETDFCFCERDADLRPRDRDDNAVQPLAGLYHSAGVRVYSDFTMTWPEPPTR